MLQRCLGSVNAVGGRCRVLPFQLRRSLSSASGLLSVSSSPLLRPSSRLTAATAASLPRPTRHQGMSSLSSPASTASSSSSTSPSSLQGYGHRVLAVLGGQWGDEGKGKLVDILAQRYDVIARFNGGSNAGHTLVVGGKKFAFHLLPCGLLYDDKQNVVGNGVVLHLPTLFAELEALAKGGRWDEEAEKRRWVETGSGRLLLSNRAHLLFDFHQEVDGLQEKGLKADSIGTTKKGIGPCYASKATRNGIRVGELLDFPRFTQRLTQLTQSVERQYGVTCDLQAELARYRGYAERIRHMVTDTAFFLHSALREGRTVLAEGANAALLDLDHGTYPYVTSSSTTAGGVCTGLGVAPRHVTGVLGVVKAYTTRVGSGPFPTELEDETGERLRRVGGEFGTTTGRPRRCGWLDLPVVQYSHALNAYDSLNVTKLDVLTGLPTVKLCTAYTIDGRPLPAGYMPSTLQELASVRVQYEEMEGWSEDISKCRSIEQLPRAARLYLQRIEQVVGVPVSWAGVGAGREDMATAQASSTQA